MGVLKAAALYFTVTFLAGFALAVVRELWLVPELGERNAELAEMPVMVAVSLVAARWVVARRAATWRPGLGARLAIGALALALLLAAELGVVVFVRGLSLAEYVEQRDPVSGLAYLAALAVFALAPALVGVRQISRPSSQPTR